MENQNHLQQASPNDEPYVSNRPIKQDWILTQDVNYFGRNIKRGSTFKQESKDSKDWFILWENDDGILMHCPGIRLHFTAFNYRYFVKQYE